MHHKLIVSLIVMLVLINGCAEPDKPLSDIESLRQQMTDLERGRYVVEIMGCNDCHTPGYLVGGLTSRQKTGWLGVPWGSAVISAQLTQPTFDYWLGTCQKRIG